MFARIAFWTPFAIFCCPGLSQEKPFVAKIHENSNSKLETKLTEEKELARSVHGKSPLSVLRVHTQVCPSLFSCASVPGWERTRVHNSLPFGSALIGPRSLNMPCNEDLCYSIQHFSLLSQAMWCEAVARVSWIVTSHAGLQLALPRVWQVNSSQQPASGKKSGLCVALKLLLSHIYTKFCSVQVHCQHQMLDFLAKRI